MNMKFKKLIVCITTAALLLSLMGLSAFAADTVVYVTISDGTLALAAEPVTVTDVDNDGILSINDALSAAHEAKFNGGAAAGYASESTEYGLSLTKLWGVENGGAYGYMVNNVSAMSLADPIQAGDHITAFVYTDTTGYSDAYCFFDTFSLSAAAGRSVTLTLTAAGYDESWNPITLPVEGAAILIDGQPTAFKTAADGSVTITIDTAGDHVISAVSDAQLLVPPVCIATINESAPQTGNAVALSVLMLTGAALLICRRRVTG